MAGVGVGKPARGIVDFVPWVVIEIVSPDDTIRKTRVRFLDNSHLGVRHMLRMDPEEYVAHRVENGSMIETRFKTLELAPGTVPFDSEEFRRFRTGWNNSAARRVSRPPFPVPHWCRGPSNG